MIVTQFAILTLLPFVVVGKLGGHNSATLVPLTVNSRTLEGVEISKVTRTIKLGVCEGICITHADCEEGLKCFHRKHKEEIPGCGGSKDTHGDFCFKPRDESEVIHHTEQFGRFGIQECHGSCKKDFDCAPGLQCLHRDGNEEIPGCTGTGKTGSNICYNNTAPNALIIMAKDGEPKENYPLAACEGHCKGIKDCELGLVCFDRSKNDTVPGCLPSGQDWVDYCTEPQLENELVLKRLDGRESSVSILGECEGECTQHGDCGEGLKCFFRASNEKVPGCSGRLDSKTGYCFKAIEGASLIFNGWSSGDYEHHLGACEGNCRSDSDCDYGLVSQ